MPSEGSDRGGWRQQRLPSKDSSETSKGANNVTKEEKPKPATKKKRALPSNPFRQSNKEEAPTSAEPLKDDVQGETDAKPQENGDLTPAHNETAPSSSANQTALPPQQPRPPHTPGLVILGTAPIPQSNRPYGYPYQRQQQQQQPNSPAPTTQSSLMILELANLMVTLATRFWFLPLLARWMARQEESIHPTQHFSWERLNDRYARDSDALRRSILTPPAGVPLQLWRRKHIWKQGRRKAPKLDLQSLYSRTAVVMDVKSDMSGDIDLGHLSDAVSFLLQQHRNHAFGTQRGESGEPVELEVVFLVQSPGGSVSTYGLAASQVQRLANEEGIRTTACVDRMAASGGFMIASQAEKLIAAPFSTIGSVGVIMEGLNFNLLAKKYGVQPLIIKAGSAKNPFSTFGPVSQQDLAREQVRLEKVHEVFKAMILKARPGLHPVLDQVADGSVFLGQEALDLQLVDIIMTSDEYIMERIQAGDRVLKLHRTNQAQRLSRLSQMFPLLPQLRQFVSDKVAASGGDASLLVLKVLQAGGFVSFLQYATTQFLVRKSP